ncbi:hypothetical protein EYC84_006798 [Monilinia fructicola]|uniref:Chitin-binding type-1 domain-containing protein n=1 Tax=Monilinia fructicola TaxID=38448 RepID=A0A5M9K8B8_MONFR|nr:hypothetical protein EYC84_006798 [Monilinia fructicola]
MHFTNTFAVTALLCASAIDAHLSLTYPVPFRSKDNPYAVESQIDYSITSPLASDGSNFPCKYNDMGTPGGKSVATWSAGATANWTIGEGALHGGGSCQVALSYDSGKSFRVIHSYIGNCPVAVDASADFTIPSDAPAGEAMFAWTWQNEIGNREFYMSCASVTIEGGSKARAAPAVAFSSRPDLFLINLGNGCTSVESTAVNYPDPGPDADVTRSSSDSGSFTGTCGPVNGVASSGSGSTSGSSSGGDSSSSSVSASSATAASASSATAASATSATDDSASSAPASVASSSTTPISIVIIPTGTAASSAAGRVATSASAFPSGAGRGAGSVRVSTNGICSGGKTCTGSTYGACCSKDGFCGNGDAWCGVGCQSRFGSCGTTLNSTSTVNPKMRGRSLRV